MSGQKQSLWITSQAGLISSSIGRIICHPLDTIKANLYIQRHRLDKIDMKDFANVVKSTHKSQGLKGFYRGVTISVVGSAPAFSLYLTIYEFVKRQNLLENKFGNHFFSGFLAEAFSCILWLPIDVVKERLQVQKQLGVYNYKGSIDAIKQIMNKEGVLGLYKGYGATLGFFGTHSAFYFMFYETLKEKLSKNVEKPQITESILTSLGAYIMVEASVISNPFDITRLRLQVQRIQQQENPNANFGYINQFHGLYLVYKHEGFLAFYRGYQARLLYGGTLTTITMTLAEFIRNLHKKSEI